MTSPTGLALSNSITFGCKPCSLRAFISAARCSLISVKVLETMTCGMLRGLLEGALVMAIRPSTDGGFDGVVVPKGRELALLFQRVTQ